jgi:two-component system, chemotaxis family, sensor kinase CheA
LTLAIIPALLVNTGGDCYAIPQGNLLELVRLNGEQARRGIEWIHGVPIHRLRGNLLPLVYLDKELGISNCIPGVSSGPINIVVLQADDRTFGLVVDAVNDTEEIVVKPLGKQLRGIPLYAGATILGDGRVALILDVLGLALSSRVLGEVRERGIGRTAEEASESNQITPCQALLLVGLGTRGRRLAICLSQVSRLEEVPLRTVERSAGREAIQYRGRIMPLLRLSELLGEPGNSGDPLQVVVYTGQGRPVGLVVDRIIDIVETVVDLEPVSPCRGIRGSAVIQQRLTDVLDVGEIVKASQVDRELLAVGGQA